LRVNVHLACVTPHLVAVPELDNHAVAASYLIAHRLPQITLEMAKREGWSTKNGSKWLTMPGQMLRYRAASFWSRAYASDISLGLYCQDEVKDFAEPPRNVTPISPIAPVIAPIVPAMELEVIKGEVYEAEIVPDAVEAPEAQKEATKEEMKGMHIPQKKRTLADLIETAPE